MSTRTYQRWAPEHWEEYAVLDSGDRSRLERFGTLLLDRPDPSAVWSRSLDFDAWDKANARFEPTGMTKGNWVPLESVPEGWNLKYRSPRLDLTFQLEMTRFKHVGVFPEQAVNWEFIAEHLKPGGCISEPLCIHWWSFARCACCRSRCHPCRCYPPSRGLDTHQHGIERPRWHPLGGGGRP